MLGRGCHLEGLSVELGIEFVALDFDGVLKSSEFLERQLGHGDPDMRVAGHHTT